MNGMPGAEWDETARPTLAALRAARASRAAALRRWLRPTLVIGGVLLGSSLAKSHYRVAGVGPNLVVGLTFVSFVALLCLAVRLFTGRPAWAFGPAPITRSRMLALSVTLPLLVVASVTLEWLQSGAGTIGLYTTVALGARVYSRRVGAVVFGICFAYLLTLTVLEEGAWMAARTGLPGLSDVVAVTAVYLLSLFASRFRAQERQEERLLTELEESRDAELRAVALAERQRLAREMHDVLAHSLSGLVLQLEGARLLAVSAPSDPRLPETIERAHQLAKTGLDEARQAIATLRDEDLPGPDRLADLAEAFTADTGVPCQFTQGGDSRELSSAVRLTLYRVTQEALTNVRKHARPDLVTVRLEYLAETVTLTVTDAALEPVHADASPLPPSGGYGLTGMRERAELLGGSVTAGPTRTGFRVQLEVPA